MEKNIIVRNVFIVRNETAKNNSAKSSPLLDIQMSLFKSFFHLAGRHPKVRFQIKSLHSTIRLLLRPSDLQKEDPA